MKIKMLLSTLLLFSLSWGQNFSTAEAIEYSGHYVQQKVRPIEIKVDDFYGVTRDDAGEYHLQLHGSQQTLIKLEGTIPVKQGYHRVTWKSDQTYQWSNGMVTDEFKVVNPASYSKNGKVYTMFGPLPEMKGSSVVITATFGPYEDSIIIHLY